MIFYLTSDGERPKLARAPAPRFIPAPLPEDFDDGDALPDPILDTRPDEERVLDGFEGYAVAFALERMPSDFERVDEAAQAILLDAGKLDTWLHARIDEAELAFRRVVKDPSREESYAAKEREARDLLDGGEGPWPIIDQIADLTGQDAAEIAAEIAERADAWPALRNRIEARRDAAKRLVTAAATEAEKRDAAAVDWAALLDPGKPVKPIGGQGPHG